MMPINKTPWVDFQRRPKVLLVDDQPANIRLLNELFRDDCDVLMATSGQQAVDVCVAENPDLVLMDILMPEMDGMEVLRKLKAIDATSMIPVIFVTGQHDDESEEEALASGAVDFITKPIRPAIVRARARTHLTLKYQSDLLRNIALIDGLTGAANRRRFDDALQNEWKRCARDRAPLSLAMIDVDHFKLYNDHYGHQAGDACLVSVSRALHKALRRPQDLLARYGGEEFVCLMPQTLPEGALRVGKQLMAEVQSLGIAHAASDTAAIVTVSIGIATTYPAHQGDFSQFLGYADQALYEAKARGRNQIVSSSLLES